MDFLKDVIDNKLNFSKCSSCNEEVFPSISQYLMGKDGFIILVLRCPKCKSIRTIKTSYRIFYTEEPWKKYICKDCGGFAKLIKRKINMKKYIVSRGKDIDIAIQTQCQSCKKVETRHFNAQDIGFIGIKKGE